MIEKPILDFWAFCLSRETYGKPHPSIYTIEDLGVWHFDLKDSKLGMNDAGFGKNKMGYLLKKYPLDALTPEGCIKWVRGDHMHYRRVDPFRGLIADLVYLKHLGFSSITITADSHAAKVHKIRASAVYPLVSNHFNDPLCRNPGFSKQILTNVGFRMERKFDNHGGTRILNDWFEQLNTPKRAQRSYDRLKSLIDEK